MKSNYVWIAFGIVCTVAAVIAIVWVSWNKNGNSGISNNGTIAQLAFYGTKDGIPPNSLVISLEDKAYAPKTLTIKSGTTVYFVNNATEPRWPASAVHPTHSIYPNSAISGCRTEEAAQMFDACRGLENGEFWAFTFNEKGNWRYHDHLLPSLTGSITVE